jgi:hypothetical protein
MPRFLVRMARAALFHSDTYEEVEADTGANLQALGVVVLAAIGMGIGSIGNSGASGIFWHTVVAIAGWYVWAWVTYLIGTRLLPGRHTVADHGELLRTIGFSSSPGILRVAMLVQPIAFPVFAVCTLWMLATMVVAVRQALDYEGTLRAVAVCAIGFPIYAIALLLSVLMLGPWPV